MEHLLPSGVNFILYDADSIFFSPNTFTISRILFFHVAFSYQVSKKYASVVFFVDFLNNYVGNCHFCKFMPQLSFFSDVTHKYLKMLFHFLLMCFDFWLFSYGNCKIRECNWILRCIFSWLFSWAIFFYWNANAVSPYVSVLFTFCHSRLFSCSFFCADKD